VHAFLLLTVLFITFPIYVSYFLQCMNNCGRLDDIAANVRVKCEITNLIDSVVSLTVS
jgi:hypothetical protein